MKKKLILWLVLQLCSLSLIEEEVDIMAGVAALLALAYRTNQYGQGAGDWAQCLVF